MNRVDRLFGIATFMQSRSFVSADRLAEKFSISVRTVYRDIKALQDVGLPVSFEPGKGYFVVPGYFLSPLSFTPEEIGAMLIAEKLIQGFADQSITRHHASAMDKVRATMKLTHKNTLATLEQGFRFQLPPCVHQDTDYLTKIQFAISEKIQLKLEYTDNKQAISQRIVEPIGIVYYAFDWHIIGWCHLRADYRDFKLKRISKLSTGLPFSRTDHIQFQHYELPVSW